MRLFIVSGLKCFLFVFFSVFRDTAAGITTYIAFQRALCVALPFFTRNALSRKRSAIVICSIAVFYLGCTFLRIANVRFVHIVNRATNSTRYVLFFSDTYRTMDVYLDLYRNITLFLEEAIIIICILVLANGLRSSKRLVERSRSKAMGISIDANQSDNDRDKSSTTVERTKGKADNKERDAVKQCLAIALFHVVYTLPRIMAKSVPLFFSVLNLSGNLRFLINLISITDSVNAGAQFFIYMRFNRKFKEFVSSKFRRSVLSEN
ncbi:chemosensory receptor c [Plakobranchus ocellatus]|uniref:Chemosensory receptor c n=1 Tax=Plakobranchus ocellatus TaxID=259542 RepID=A0AAV4D5N1_9GAST|nr:chemosensory receptor c [Plakobranchus ocellatus]